MSVVRCCSPRPIGPRRTLASGSRSGPWRTLSTSSRSAAVNSSRRELLLTSTALVGGAAVAKAPVALAEGAESQAAPTAALELAPVPKIQLADDLEISRVRAQEGHWWLVAAQRITLGLGANQGPYYTYSAATQGISDTPTFLSPVGHQRLLAAGWWPRVRRPAHASAVAMRTLPTLLPCLLPASKQTRF